MNSKNRSDDEAKSENLWKDRAEDYYNRMRTLETKSRNLEESRDNWHGRAKSYKEQLEEALKKIEQLKKENKMAEKIRKASNNIEKKTH